MATISENLITLNEAKANIKAAIESKGQDLTDVPFTQYADKISAIQTGGGTDRLQWICDNVRSLAYTFRNYMGEDLSPAITGLDTSKVENMMYMCDTCVNITNLNLSTWNTSNVTNMSNIFRICSGLTNLNLSTWDTGKANNMSYMFYQCSNLTELDLHSFNTSNVTNMSYMFNGCKKLTKLDLSNFDTSNVTNMSYMFGSCPKIAELNVSSFDTSKVTNMGNMFIGMDELIEVDLRSFDTSKVTTFSNLFNNCDKLKTVLGTIDVISATYTIELFALCRDIETFTVKNIKQSFTTSTNNSYNSKLTLDTLVNIFKELWDLTGSTSKTLKLSRTNKDVIANIYVKLVDVTDEMLAQDQYAANKKPCVVCESTDEGAMTITEYAVSKNWSIA